jgi:hypothetical protein
VRVCVCVPRCVQQVGLCLVWVVPEKVTARFRQRGPRSAVGCIRSQASPRPEALRPGALWASCAHGLAFPRPGVPAAKCPRGQVFPRPGVPRPGVPAARCALGQVRARSASPRRARRAPTGARARAPAPRAACRGRRPGRPARRGPGRAFPPRPRRVASAFRGRRRRRDPHRPRPRLPRGSGRRVDRSRAAEKRPRGAVVNVSESSYRLDSQPGHHWYFAPLAVTPRSPRNPARRLCPLVFNPTPEPHA